MEYWGSIIKLKIMDNIMVINVKKLCTNKKLIE